MSYVAKYLQLGADITTFEPSSSPYVQHPLGAQAISEDGNIYRWMKAGGSITKGTVVKAVLGGTSPFNGVLVSDGANDVLVGLAPADYESGEYGWFLKEGLYDGGDVPMPLATVSNGDPATGNGSGGVTKAQAASELVNAIGIILDVESVDSRGSLLVNFL